MENNKLITIFILLSALMIGALPIINYAKNKKTDTASLYSTDIIEGYINFFFYRTLNKSLESKDVITGKDGFLFLGNKHNNLIQKLQGHYKFDEKSIDNWTNKLKKQQLWYESHGIKFAMVIAPNKHSIHDEKLPEWLVKKNINFTDKVYQSAHQKGLNLLDVRNLLKKEKTNNQALYLKKDTHWNSIGAALTFSKTIDYLNDIYGLNIMTPKFEMTNFLSKRNDLKILLIIMSFYPQKDDNELQFAFNDTHEICIGDIDKVTFGFDVCTNKNNPSYSIYGQPKYSINAKPLNDLNLLMIGDSFATNHSQLYSSTFKNIWKSHYSHMQGKNLTKFIHNNKPDVVIYQVVERAFFRNSLVKNLSLINPVNENHVTLKKEIFDIYNDKYNYANNQKFSLKNQIYHIIKKDPHIILNNTYANSEYSVINIDINSDQESLLQIFYKPRKTLTYSELNSFRYKIKKGTNNITLEVPSHYINNQLRIDLGHNLGTYQLNKFLIHQI